MNDSWLSLVPPIIVLLAGFLTRRVLLSLLLGIISAAFIVQNFSLYNTAALITKHFSNNLELANYASYATFWENQNSFICIFLFCLSIIITLISHSGGAYAYGVFIKKKLKSPRSAEVATLILSSCLFVDDYFSALTVSAVMKPITDQFKIPRVKLALLVDSMAAPLAIIAPISSWVATITGFLSENGFSDQINNTQTLVLSDAFSAYTRLIPFMIYTFIIIASVWFIILRKISFGPMHQFELIAQESGNLHGGREEEEKEKIHKPSNAARQSASIKDFILPVFTLIASVFVGIAYTGGYHLFGGDRSLITALQNTQVYIALFFSGIGSVTITVLFFFARKKLLLSELAPLIWKGIKLMAPSIAVLLLAWTFGDLLRNDLKTGEYLASSIAGKISPNFLPFLFFLVSSAISFSLGSSWGTAALMFPIAIPLVLSSLEIALPATLDAAGLLFPVLGAILSGSVFGDHISPISDTTIMSSTGSGARHIDHVRTQIPYAIPAFLGSSIAFFCICFLPVKNLFLQAMLSTGIGIAVSLILLTLLDQSRQKHKR